MSFNSMIGVAINCSVSHAMAFKSRPSSGAASLSGAVHGLSNSTLNSLVCPVMLWTRPRLGDSEPTSKMPCLPVVSRPMVNAAERRSGATTIQPSISPAPSPRVVLPDRTLPRSAPKMRLSPSVCAEAGVAIAMASAAVDAMKNLFFMSNIPELTSPAIIVRLPPKSLLPIRSVSRETSIQIAGKSV